MMISDKGSDGLLPGNNAAEGRVLHRSRQQPEAILYVEAANQGEPLEVSLTNPATNRWHSSRSARRRPTISTSNCASAATSSRPTCCGRCRNGPMASALTVQRRHGHDARTGARISSRSSKTMHPSRWAKAKRGASETYQVQRRGAGRRTRRRRIQVRYRTEPQDPAPSCAIWKCRATWASRRFPSSPASTILTPSSTTG